MTTIVRTTSAGALAQLEVNDLSLLLYPSTELETGPANLWLRRRVDGVVVQVRPLTGPASAGSAFEVGELTAVRGQLDGVGHLAWFDADDEQVLGWRWEVTNTSSDDVELDLVCAMDIALAPLAELRRSEYYVSQYLDLTPISVPGSTGGASTAIAVRQNMPGNQQPWAALGSSEPVSAWASDALQLVDLTRGESLDPTRELPGERLQHEHTLAALQTESFRLGPGEARAGVFWIMTVPDHQEATGPLDSQVLADRLARRSWAPAPRLDDGTPITPTVFCPVQVAPVGPPTEEPDGLTSVERDAAGQLLSGFTRTGHVVSAPKERAVLRPHGSILHFSPEAVADGRALASTVWMSGVFASQLTRGPASSNERLSIRRSYLGLQEAAGTRVFVSSGGDRWQLLTTPALWETSQREARWSYPLAGDLSGTTVVVSASLPSTGEVLLEVAVHGAPLDVLVVAFPQEQDLQITCEDAVLGGDAPLFADGRSRGLTARTLLARALQGGIQVRLGVPATVPEAHAAHHWKTPHLSHPAPEITDLDNFLTALTQDAAVHFQAPRGLEQYTGGAWGVRDVCQGPVGLLLATDELAALRHTITQIFAGQQDDGDWPQWFHFLPEMAGPGHRESHGDVVYWPLLALGEYLAVTGDASVLDESVPLVGQTTILPAVTIREHVALAVQRIRAQRTRDDRLPAYGHGDWNDSLQPARPDLAHHMCSTWTTELEIQALELLASQLQGRWPEMADELSSVAARTRSAFDEVLLVDGELAGYVVLGDGPAEPLVHPHDTRTGLHHGLLQMVHAISDELLSPEQARHHQELIAQHLSGPTGSYLFDRPVTYNGGPMTVFKRAEAATFWGREIGLMYTHAHVRHVEALSHLGMPDEMWDELLKVVPATLTRRVEGAAPRQHNCYFSSSDAGFADRGVASSHADDLFDPATRFEGGWRVYSSGPGLVLRLVVEKLLGVRQRSHGLEIDPVLPAALDGLTATVHVGGREVRLTYRVGARGCGVSGVLHEDRPLATRRLEARYRPGGVHLVDRLDTIAPHSPVLELEVLVGQ